MANEITVNASLKCINGSFEFPKVGGTQITDDQSTAGGGTPGSMTATTAANGVDVDFTELTQPKWTYIKNLDATNYVMIGHWDAVTFFPVVRLHPGKACVFPQDPSFVMRIKADTASCLVQIQAMDA